MSKAIIFSLLIALATFTACGEIDDWIRDPVPEIIDNDGSIEPKDVRCNRCVDDTPETEECSCLAANECELKDLKEEYQGDLIGCSVMPTPLPTSQTKLERCEERRKEPNGSCNEIRFGDGRGGNLSKIGDNRGEFTVLVTGLWQNFATVEALKTNGAWELLTFSGCANPESTGAFRPHHRGAVGDNCGNFTGKLRVCDVAKCCEVTTPNGACNRNDRSLLKDF